MHHNFVIVDVSCMIDVRPSLNIGIQETMGPVCFIACGDEYCAYDEREGDKDDD
jgi:hypothetical protein